MRTGLGAWAVTVKVSNLPTAIAKSRTAVAVNRPGPTGVPDVSTSSPDGTVTWTSKSAVGVDDVSARSRVGGSVSQPTPGSHASTGKNEPSRSAAPERESRSRTGPGTRRRNGTSTATALPAASGCASATTSVVGSGRLVARRNPADTTGPAARCAPSSAWSGPLGQRRKTSRRVGRSGVNLTCTRPVTSPVAGTPTVSR